MNDQQLIEKAIKLSAEEKYQLELLFRKAGFDFSEEMAQNVGELEIILEDIFQENYEEIAPILQKLAEAEKKPSRTKIILALAGIGFTKNMKNKATPKILSIYAGFYKNFSAKYDTRAELNFNTGNSSGIKKWVKGLPKLMGLSQRETFVNLLQYSFIDGKGPRWFASRLAQSSEFSHARARTTAITEVMRMYSGGQFESMMNNPNIVGKVWRHTSGIGQPRMSHGVADGMQVAVDDYFMIDGERMRYPRDPNSSPENTINCHCFMVPVLADNR